MAAQEVSEIKYRCGKGWTQLVDVTIYRLRQAYPKIIITDVRQKYGSLKITYKYHTRDFEVDAETNGLADEIGSILEEAAQKASVTCEKCGAIGATLRSYSEELIALCDAHHSGK